MEHLFAVIAGIACGYLLHWFVHRKPTGVTMSFGHSKAKQLANIADRRVFYAGAGGWERGSAEEWTFMDKRIGPRAAYMSRPISD